MDAAKKGIGKARGKYFRPELFYARVYALRLVNQKFYFQHIISYELSPFHSSLFEKKNVLRRIKLMSNMMKTLKIESNARYYPGRSICCWLCCIFPFLQAKRETVTKFVYR